MTAKQIDARLAALEKRDAPPGKLLVCSCATSAGRRNVEGHAPGCPALTAEKRDTLLVVRYADVLQSPLPSVT